MLLTMHECKLDRKRNCTVRALATSANLPYEEAYQIAKEAGRKDNTGFKSAKLLKYYNKKVGSTAFRKVKRSAITVQKFCRVFPLGSYYVRKKGHAYAIVNGVVYDTQSPKPRERILEAWKYSV